MNDDFYQTLIAGAEPQTSNALVPYDPEIAAQNDPRSDMERDFDSAREALANTVTTASEGLEEFARLAKQMQDPRSYDVLSKLIAASTTAAKALIEIHKYKKESKPENEAEGQKVVNNTVIMTMEDMRKILQERITAVQEPDDED